MGIVNKIRTTKDSDKLLPVLQGVPAVPELFVSSWFSLGGGFGFRWPGLLVWIPHRQEEVNRQSMFDKEAETLTYEPTSFLVHQISTTDPDSPRHFNENSNSKSNENNSNSNDNSDSNNNANKNNNTNNSDTSDSNDNNNNDNNKDHNNNNSSSGTINIIAKRNNAMNRKKLRERQQSLMDLPSSVSGKRLSSEVQKVRSKTFPSPGIVRSQTIQEGGSRSYSKPITARLKVREKRRMTLDSKPASPWRQQNMTSQVPLTRSKSDIGTYDWSKELTREEMQKKCRALLKARLCVMDTSSCESFSEADSYLDTSSSSFYELFPN